MISELSRFVYLADLRVSTKGNLFPDQVPTASTLFNGLMNENAKNSIETVHGNRKIKIQEIKIENNFAILLIRSIDPSIPDHVMMNLLTEKSRINLRKKGEAPVVTAHIVVNLSTINDKNKCYPICIENNEFLPRSSIINHLNTIIARHFTRLQPWISAKKVVEQKEWSPRIAMATKTSATVENLLTAGGRLKGVKWVEEEDLNGTTGDGTFNTQIRKESFLSLSSKPTGSAAISALRAAKEFIPFKKSKKISIMIEDENAMPKVIGLASNSTDVLGAMFFRQEVIHLPLSDTLSLYSPNIHNWFASTMRTKAK